MSEDFSDLPENQDDVNEEDVFTILVATDIHLGYAERDPIRCKFNSRFNLKKQY